MKLLYSLAALAGATHAFNVNTFAKKAISQIWKPRGKHGFEISLEPYFQMKCDITKKMSDGSPNGVLLYQKKNCKGDYRTDETGKVNTFTRNIVYDGVKKELKINTMDKGNTVNLLGSNLWLPGWNNSDVYWKQDFFAKWKVPAKAKMEYTSRSDFDKWKGMKDFVKITAKEVKVANGAYTAKAKIQGYLKMPVASDGEELPESLNPFGAKTSKWNFELKGGAAQVCAQSPTMQGCKVSAGIKGSYVVSKKKYLNHQLEYQVRGGGTFALVFTAKKKMCELVLQLGQYVIDIHTRSIKPKASTPLLALRLPFAGSKPAIKNAAIELYKPFENYVMRAITDTDIKIRYATVAHAVVWIDLRFKIMRGEFDCSKLVKATKIESKWLSNKYKLKSVQDFLKTGCKNGNTFIIRFLKGQATNEINKVRTYANNLTGDVGKVRYVEWLKTVMV